MMRQCRGVGWGVSDTMVVSLLSLILYSMVTLLQANLYDYTSPSSSATSERNLTPQEICPVILQVNHSNYCKCDQGLLEITCFHLDEVPLFKEDDDNLYNGIYMRRQAIQDIPPNTFFNLKVKKIVMDFNPLGDNIHNSALNGLDVFLQELSFGGCKIKYLPQNLLYGLIELRYLHLWDNQIQTIPLNFFNHARELNEILLWGNQISELHKDSFTGLRKLRKLDLEDNRISILEKGLFRDLDSLLSLHLGQNHLATLFEETFVPLVSLKVLNLDDNGLKFIYPTAFRGLRGLLSLSLNNNGISLLTDRVFSSMRNLTSLYLHNNELGNKLWKKHFTDLHSLRLLDLSRNKVHELQDGVFKALPNLRHLYLDNNDLVELQTSVFDPDTHLQILSLLGNPMKCDCHLSWLVQLAESGSTIWGSCNHTVLAYPTSVTDSLNYRNSQLNCYGDELIRRSDNN